MVKILNDAEYKKLLESKKEDSKQRRGKVAKLNKQINTLEDIVSAKDREIAKLKDDLKALQTLNNDYVATKETEIKLETREKLLKAKEAEFESITKELAQNRKKADEAREEGIKKGYADGLADGLREASKITAEDRKMMAQIAALAASSHTPDAATEIAKSVLKDVTNALPASTKKR